MTSAEVNREITQYRASLMRLLSRFEIGERASVGIEAMALSDELICLLEEAPRSKRTEVDYLIDRFEALRISCLD